MIKRIFISVFLILQLLIGSNVSFAINDGTAINSSSYSDYPTYSPDGQYIVYRNCYNGCKLYKKNANDDTDNGKPITSYNGDSPTYSPDGKYIVYSKWDDGNKLYKKNANDDTGNGTAITSSISIHPTYSPDGQYIVYRNCYNGCKLYKKNANDDTDNGTAITSVGASNPTYSPDGQYIVYVNNIDGKIYKKNANDTDNGIPITSYRSAYPTYSPDSNYIIYSNWDDGNKLYKKKANEDNNNGTAITSVGASNPTYSPDGKYIIYSNENNGFKLYKISMEMEDESNGNYQHYILNRLTATEGNMKNLNNSSPVISFSNYNAVKNNFLANYQYRKSWYEAKGLTSEVLSKNVKWNERVIFSKSDLTGGMLDDFKLSANYDFKSDDEMDNVDSSIFWRGNLSNTSFQSDENWNTVGLPAYVIRNQNGNIVGYLEYPCGNLICKDKGCSDIKNIVNAGVVVNKSPTPTFSSFSVNKNAKYVSVLTATDPEKDTLTYSKTINANHGTVVILSNGTFGYLPVTNYVGTDTFTYSVSDGKNPGVSKQVNITVNDIVPLNNPPTPTYNSFYTNKNTSYNGNLTATDSDGDTLSYNIVASSKKGTLNVSSNGSFTYNPNSYYVGADSFIYSVTDGKSSAITKTVNIMVNDYIPGNIAPIPTFSSLSTNKNIKYLGVLTATDSDGGNLYYNIVSDTNYGSISVGNNGNFTYIPNNNYTGTDSFVYSVSDGYNASVNKNVNINVNNTITVNNSPIPTYNSFYTNKDTVHNGNLTASDIENDTLTYSKVSDPSYGNIIVNSNGSFTYTPSNGYVGTDSFIYSVADGYNSAVQKLVSIQVNDVEIGNTPPVIGNIPPITVEKNTPINIIIDETDKEGDTIIYTTIIEPINGTVTVSDNGNINYIPNNGFLGTDNITIGVSDGINPPVEKVINIVVNDTIIGNFPPVAVFSSFSTGKNKAHSNNLTAVDPDNDDLTYSLLSQPLNGNIIINSSGSFIYTPNNGYSGTDLFTYAVFDGHNNPVSGTVNIIVIPSTDTVWDNPTPPTNEKEIFCTATNNGTTNAKTILVLNPRADTKFIQDLKGKGEYIKTISSSGSINNFDKIVEDIVKDKVKTSKLNPKSSLYDFGSGGNITGIQYNLTKIPNSAVMRKLVDLAIDHSTQTMTEYTQTMKDNCLSSSHSSSETIPAGFIEVDAKGDTILNLFRFNGK